MIAAVATYLGALKGARRLAAAFLAGAALILAFPPYANTPALWLAFPALIWLLDGCATRSAAAATGWAFGFGHFSTSFYWIANAFYVDRETFGVLAVPAVGALCAAVALFIALVCALTQILPPPHEDEMPDDRVVSMTLRIVWFAALWTIVEWVRSWLLTGFPWNPLATVWSETRTPLGLPMIQVTKLIGTYGLSFLTAVIACLPAVLGHVPRLRRAWITAGTAVGLIAVVGGAGALWLTNTPTRFVAGLKFRLVQAAIPQIERAHPSQWEAQLQDYVRLSIENRPSDVTHVIWGEAAAPPTYLLNLDEPRRAAAAVSAPPGGLLITGADRGIRGEAGFVAIYNSLYALAPGGDILATYDKAHLVPFGEYMPLRWLIPFDKITGGMGDFASGPGLALLAVPTLPPFTPLICYEVVFSGRVTARVDSVRPRWLLNLTNDAWFGLSAGPHQHLAAARLRAAEEGLPLVRAANSGISAVLDGQGRTVAELGLGERGVLDVPLPEAGPNPTPFGLLGNFIPLLIITVAGAMAFYVRRRISRSPR